MTREERIKAMGEGPWVDEPDHVAWRSAHGYPCILHRALHASDKGGGHWCGYVGVPPGHPWHGQPMDSSFDGPEQPRVHGGITYAEPCNGHICHVPEPGESDDVFWLGFDAAHAGDLQPLTQKLLRDLRHDADVFMRDDVYRDMAYMRAQCECLADQAVRAASEAAP